MKRLSETSTSARLTRAISLSEPRGSWKWCAATRQATTSKLESANGISSRTADNGRLHPRRRVDGHDLEPRLAQDARDVSPSGGDVQSRLPFGPLGEELEVAALAVRVALAVRLGPLRPDVRHRDSSTARFAASSIVASTWMLSRPASSRICRPSSAFVPSKRTTIGCSIFVWSSACSIPWATMSQRVIPGEDVEEDRLHLRVGADDLERVDDALRVAAPAEVAEVRRLAARERDHVQRGHDQAGPVAEDPDLAVELHVGDALLARRALLGRIRLEVAHLRDVRMLVERVVVDRELRVERLHLALGRDDQRVDLAEHRVRADERVVEPLDDREDLLLLVRIVDPGARR